MGYEKILLVLVVLSLVSCKKDDSPVIKSTVDSTSRYSEYNTNANNQYIKESVYTCAPTIYGIHSTDVTLFGKVLTDGGNHQIQRGICYKLISIFNPTMPDITNNNVLCGTGLGVYSTDITLPQNWYSARVYVINSFGTITYGNTVFSSSLYI
jgi:hypothetical protein